MAQFQPLPNNALGANVEQLRELGKFINDKIAEVEGLFNSIDAKINGTTWAGPDATKFAGDWDAYRASTLNAMKDRFGAESQRAITNAETQQTTSNN